MQERTRYIKSDKNEWVRRGSEGFVRTSLSSLVDTMTGLFNICFGRGFLASILISLANIHAVSATASGAPRSWSQVLPSHSTCAHRRYTGFSDLPALRAHATLKKPTPLSDFSNDSIRRILLTNNPLPSAPNNNIIQSRHKKVDKRYVPGEN